MHIALCHHLSLSYFGGGEKFIISLAKELIKRGHDVEIYALPFLLDDKPKINPKEVLEDIPYTEGLRHKVRADVTYITYNPLSWLNFKSSHPRIAGIHSHAYWFPPHPSYGLLPNLANITNRFTSYFELRGFDAVHTVTNVFPVNHPKIYYIPNFVDSEKFKPHCEKESEFTIAYASRKVWQKGWDVFKNVRKHVDANFLISGTVPDEEMPLFLSKAHVTLVPSKVDTFGLSIVESMMCETPVITTPLEAHKALELPSIWAASTQEFISKLSMIRKLQEDKWDQYKSLCNICRISALKFDKMRVVEQLEKMFKEVAS